MELRYYQKDAVNACYRFLAERDDNPCIVIPTGGGKTPVIATIARDVVMRWQGRILILAHVKELLEQAAEKLVAMEPKLMSSIGIYSAGLNRRDTDDKIIIGGIQSVYKRACDLGRFDLILTDECFTEGTLIDTPRGETPIEELYIGQPVRHALGVGCITAISSRPATEFIRLELSNGRTIECTPNHPFFTKDGWRPAGTLAEGAFLYSREDMQKLRERNPGEMARTLTGKNEAAEGRCELLQTRCGNTLSASGHTVGRMESPDIKNASSRQKNTNHLGGVRVVSVTHFKQKSPRVVYNLQVEGHPSYYANGILVHNCHMIPEEGEGMYRSFLADMKIINPQVRLIGLTATPYRMTTGMVCAPENLLNEICYEVGIRELITQGFLSPLISKAARGEVDTDGLHIRGGEFIQQEVESLMTADNVVNTAVHETVQATADRKSVLIFCAGVNHANDVLRNLRERGCEAEGVFGDTLPGFREKYLSDFKAGRLKYLVNVGVLTTGFDAPNVDCVVLLRPTKSPGLYYQMCGRGFRIADNKPNCLILDFGGNIERHGPLDAIDPGERMRKRAKGEEPGEPPTRKCPECLTVMPAQYSSCPTCGYVFPVAPPHDAHSGTAGILTGQIDYETVPVQETHYAVHVKRGADPDAPRTMRVDYCIDLTRIESEWVCPEHTGYAREKFVRWWERMAAPGTPIPETAWDAVTLANEGVLAEVKAIRIRHISGERFSRIVDYELGTPGTFVPEPGWNDEATPAETISREELDAIPF